MKPVHRLPDDAVPLPEEAVKEMAASAGDRSASAIALRDAEQKRSTGQEAAFMWSDKRRMLFVVSA